MTFEILFVLLALLGMVIALVLDKMRPGMVLFSVVVLFLCAGILTPKEMLEGFSNKGMMTVAMLFLVSEGIRQSGALGQVIKKLLPQGKTTVFKAQFRMLPTIAFISAFLNNTPVVVIFAPIIKRWAESVKLPATKFLIPLSYVTIFDRMLMRKDKEDLLKQHSVMVWFTGLSGSGKSTIAIALERELHKRGLLCRILDGDNIRSGINNNLGFTEADRVENIRRIAEVSKLFLDTGVITIAAFISPNNDIREMAADIIGQDDFLEVYVSTPLEECERRDVKGLYAKARKGEIKNFTGISAPFEEPAHPALTLDTSVLSLEESVNKLLELILPRIQKK